MSNIDKRALREAAEKATPGPWYVHDKPCEDGNYGIDTSDKEFLAEAVVWWGFSRQSIWREEDAKRIAAANPATVLALLDELEAKDSTIATQQQEIRTLLNALGQSSEKRNSDHPDQKRIIGWRASDYTDETSAPELAKNWAAAIGVLPIFEGDVNTKLSAAAAGKGEAL
ncbi:ead/Ea22-like family protein [Enterobacter cloacae]|uniref:ead/Ea22-like family protein n=1 Tax=Enterobacter cloacae TaxID=550 RepID=UPI002005EF57|nr:ead/Ea22-like family protein [Enterobacter cloacae]MCK7102487.1 ead/Ea22-like family protein [Enterobacter cloacae]